MNREWSVQYVMSSLSSKSAGEMQQILERLLQEIPNPANRDVVRNYCEERLAGGLKPSTIGIDANALRSLGLFLSARSPWTRSRRRTSSGT